MSKSRGLVRSLGTVSFFTFLSRILGLLRDMAFAQVFGSGLVADAFFVAFRIPNLLRKLFAEGSLTVAFVPVFSDYLVNRGEERAFGLARTVLSLLIVILSFVTLVGILLSPWIVTITAYGFKVSPEKFQLTVLLTRVMFPYILLISVVAFYMGLLNSFGHFGAPAAAPVFLNVMMIISIYWISPLFKEPIIGVAIGVLLGGVLQVLLQVPFSLSCGFIFRPNFGLREEGLKQIVLLILPTLFGSAVYQLNQVIGTVLASFLKEGSVSWLYYADRLVQFPLGIFGVAMGTVSLPSLAVYASKGDMESYRRVLNQAMRILIFISVPSTVGLCVLAEPIVRLFFQRGRFAEYDTLETSRALWSYGVGLLAFSQIRVLVSAFFALRDSKTPVYVASLALVLNFAIGVLLMGPLRHMGLALALSIASTVQALCLIFILSKKVEKFSISQFKAPFLKSLVASIIMGVILYSISTPFFGTNDSSFYLLVKVFSLVLMGIVVYVITARILKVEELRFLRLRP